MKLLLLLWLLLLLRREAGRILLAWVVRHVLLWDALEGNWILAKSSREGLRLQEMKERRGERRVNQVDRITKIGK